MDFTSTASSAAKLSWIRLAISLFFITASLSADGPLHDFFVKSDNPEVEKTEKTPIRDFFIKDPSKKTKDKKRTPIRSFFFKDTEDKRDECVEEKEGMEALECYHNGDKPRDQCCEYCN